ncbi:cyclic nucleotide-binding domain-containing protein [Rickettsiales bacterium]|nr:cyclic nucleotide-binding domain-containing protein [Rickettsiales bacterium]
MNKDLISWKAGTVIYKFNDQSDFAYLLKEGQIEILSENGTKIGFINSNEIFGDQSCLLNTKRTVETRASKNSKAIRIPKDVLINEYEKSPLIIQAILRSTYLRLTNISNIQKKSLESI